MIGVNTSIFQPSAIAAAVDLALFSLLNETSIVPEIGTHTSFTAGAGFIKNSDGFYQSLPTDCARFEGARYVRNLFTYSEDFSHADWTIHPTDTTKVGVALGIGPNGEDAMEVTFATANAYLRQNVDGAIGSLANGTFYIAAKTGTINVTTYNGRSFSSDITIGTTFQKITSAGTLPWAGINKVVGLYGGSTNNGTFYIINAQAEFKESYNATDKFLPSEYASTNVESAPYHDVGADGVKVFDVELANTVVGNVLTEVDGTVAITGIEHQLYEPTATNLHIYSRDFGSWGNTGTPVVTQDQTGFDNRSSTAWTVEDDDVAALEAITSPVVITTNDTSTYVWTIRILKDTNETRFPEFQYQLGGGTTQYIYTQLNTKTGAVVNRGALGTVSSSTTLDGDWWVLKLSIQDNTSGNLTLSAKIFPAVTTTWNAAEAAAVGSIVLDTSQVEKTSYATSFIETTGSAVTRNSVIDRKIWPNNTQNNFKITCKFTYGGKDINNHKYVIGAGAAAVNSLRLIYVPLGTDKLACYISKTSNYFIVGTKILVEGTTYDLRFEMENDICILYVDDVQDGSTVDLGGDLVLAVNSPLYIGSSYAGSAGIKGHVYDVLVENL